MVKSVLKYHGGAAYKAPMIAAVRPKAYSHYLEPYFGGGSVLFNLDPNGVSEIVNDIDEMLMSFWYALQTEELFQRLQKRLLVTPFARKCFEDALRIYADPDAHDQVEKAWAVYVRQRQSRQALGKDFATLTKNRLRGGMNEQVSAWLSSIDDLPEFRPRLQRVLLECCMAVPLIRRQDAKDLWAYVDPPFHPKTRKAGKYRHEMNHTQHEELLDMLGKMKGKFSLSGYRCELYDQKAEQYKWRRLDFNIDNKASSSKEKSQVVESLWLNYEPDEAAAREVGFIS